MVFKKPISELEYDDIYDLMRTNVDESEILDYKTEILDTDKNADKSLKEVAAKNVDNLLKEVAAFSNTSGGFLIYGVKESGQGGHPIAINGISNINKERLEQIIIDNIRPRVRVLIKPIAIPGETDKNILIIQIPEGQNKPYLENKTKCFFKRYNFIAMAMSEHEIDALYLKRFFGAGEFSRYIDNAVLSNRALLYNENGPLMDAHVLITPLRVSEKLLDTSEMEYFVSNLSERQKQITYHGRYYSYNCAEPSKNGIRWGKQYGCVEVHRNGLVHCMMNAGGYPVDTNKEDSDDHGFRDIPQRWALKDLDLKKKLLDTIQFSSAVYSELDFLGKVKLVLRVMNTKGSVISKHYQPSLYSNVCDADEIYIEREWNSWELNNDYIKIGESMLDELSNYYGLWDSPRNKKEN
jgi:hypothetical protein